MGCEPAIVAKLTAAGSPVQAVVAGRIAAATAPDALARPYIVYQLLGTRRTHSNDGPCGLARATLQLACYADGYGAAKQLAAAVRVALDGFSGVVGEAVIQAVMLADERDAPQPPSNGTSQGVAGVVLVFRIAHND